MYKYIYVQSKAAGFFTDPDHREIIDKYSKEGWRFVAAIPTWFNGEGKIKEYDLVFEKEE